VKRIHVDDIETLPALEDGELQWKPVRYTLGIDAFGINAYQGKKEGDLVVEEHADPHQELYLVLSGRARFQTDDDEFEAPAGTFVLFEPRERRVAHAAEPGTTVVAVGAEAKRFEPSQWEYGFRGWGLARLGRHDEARAAIEDGLQRYPDSSRLLYDFACVEAVAGNGSRAIELLRRSVQLEPKNAAHARNDADFDSIRDDPEFESAIAGQPDSDGAGA
jgi:quercetin dioxygenase-like cupin family protein